MYLFILNVIAWLMIVGSTSTIAKLLYIQWYPYYQWRQAYAYAEKAYENHHLRG